MPSKKQDVAKSNIFSVLFISVDGEPMSFYLRPGPSKSRLQPLITAGGGLMCKMQQPGAILLIDPEERGSIPESTAHWYVSTQYIHDCIEKDEQLNLEDYRLNPEVVRTQPARHGNSKKDSPGLSGGRAAYTPEEDADILSYVSQHKTEVGGNRLWQQMEKQRVTSHSWQSMKYRYRVRLAQKHSEVKDAEATEEELKAAEEETEEEENPETEDAAPLQTHSAETDLTQIDAEPQNVEAQASSSPQQEVQHVNPQTDEQLAESTQVEIVEAETPNAPQPEEKEEEVEAMPVESTEPKTDLSKTNISPQKENVPEDSQPAEPVPLPSTSSSKEKEKASPELDRPQRRTTRRQLELEMPQPYSKKLRSAATSVKQPSSSPKLSKKMKSAVKSAAQKDTTVDQPPPKRARGRSAGTVAESQQEESVQATVSETVPADEESDSVPQTGEKKTEKRKLGILELATKEFEDDSEFEDEAPHIQDPAETAAQQPTSTDPLHSSSDTAGDAVSTQCNPEPGPSLQENVQEAPASRSNRLPETSCPQPAAAGDESAAAAEEVQATSRAHLFIFDRESQEEDSQSMFGDGTAAKPTVNKDAVFSLTQVQLEEDKQQIRELISQTNQDLISVTKALLRTSGDFSAALDLLLNPSSISGPSWNRCDDSRLLSADPAVRQQLLEKYGEENVAKRILFLEVEA